MTGPADSRPSPSRDQPGPLRAGWPAPAVQSLTTRQRSDLQVLLADARGTHSWAALGKRIHRHVRAGVRLEEIADALGVGVPRVRMIRLRHSGYDPAADRGVARQVGEWGSVHAAAAAAGTTVSTLGEHVADATAAGVTSLYGQRRLWHAPATAAWWAKVAAAADASAAKGAAARTDRSSEVRRLHAAGVPAAAIAADLGIGVTTVRRTLRWRGVNDG